MNARDRPGIDMSGIEQCKERSFGPAIETLNDQPAFVARGAGPGGEHRLSRHDVGAEIEDLRLAAQIIHAFDAGVDAELTVPAVR